MPSAQVWTGQEVLHLARFRDVLRAASRMVGRDDLLANLLLEDALEELRCVLGERATPIAAPGRDARSPRRPQTNPPREANGWR